MGGTEEMTKQQLILLLKQYKENRARLKLKLREKERILRQLESIKEINLKTSSLELNSDIRSKNSISDKVGNYATDNTDKENDLKLELQALEQEIIELNSMIEEIDIRLDALKYKEKQILIAYYIDGCTYEDIGNRVYFRLFNQTRSARHIQRMIERATEKIIELRLKMS